MERDNQGSVVHNRGDNAFCGICCIDGVRVPDVVQSDIKRQISFFWSAFLY